MNSIISFTLSLALIIVFSLILKKEAFFWLEKIIRRIKKNKTPDSRGRTIKPPIKKYCGFRDWSDEGGEVCGLFRLEDNAEYLVSEEICRQCPVWDRYEQWLTAGRQKNLSVTLAHTLRGSWPMVVETDQLNPEIDHGLNFNDFIIKKRRVPWAGKAAIAFLTLVTYLIVYFSGIFTSPIARAMPDVFYFTDDGSKAVAGSWNMWTTDPASAADSTSKCMNQDAGNSSKLCNITPGSENNTWESSTWTNPKKKGWMTYNDDLLNGTIPSGDWQVTFKYNFATNDDCSYTRNRIAYKIWKADSSLNNSSVIHNWDIYNIPGPGTAEVTDTAWNPGAITFNNEVIHIEWYWYVEISCLTAPFDSISLIVDEGGDTEQINTPAYAPVPENSLFLALIVPFVPLIMKKIKTRKKLTY